MTTIAEVTGQTIDFQEVTPREFAQAQIANGVPAEQAQALEYLNTVFRKGRAAYITDDVQNLTGRAPGTFREWCERNSDALR